MVWSRDGFLREAGWQGGFGVRLMNRIGLVWEIIERRMRECSQSPPSQHTGSPAVLVPSLLPSQVHDAVRSRTRPSGATTAGASCSSKHCPPSRSLSLLRSDMRQFHSAGTSTVQPASHTPPSWIIIFMGASRVRGVGDTALASCTSFSCISTANPPARRRRPSSLVDKQQ